jgi:hypothetical protein
MPSVMKEILAKTITLEELVVTEGLLLLGL